MKATALTTSSRKLVLPTVSYGWTVGGASQPHHTYGLNAILKVLPQSPCNILDVGCGNGYITGKISELGHHVIGIDSSADGIEIARKMTPHVRFETHSAYEEITSIARDLDVILAAEVVEHLFAPRLFFENAYRALKPGGSLILSVPYHGYFKNLGLSVFNLWDRHLGVSWEGGHIKFFSRRTLQEMLKEAGFSDFSFRGVGRTYGLWKSMIIHARKK